MSMFIPTVKQAGVRTLNVTQRTRITASSFTSAVTNLPCTGASAKLSAPILRRTVSSSSQRDTDRDEPDGPSDRYAINTERSEYSKSGTDNSVAAQNSAWNVQNLTPEQAKEESARESLRNGPSKASPLEVSPANQDVSRSTDESGRGASVVHGPSRRVSPKKGKKVDYGGGPAEAGSGHESTKS
ncbi:hypothetical protein PRK78_003727 [Emydomyces testavorans]|uniref:Uncharacterized protein n=1 Tax=Emydomyces testavorans TaxID=2070801 RepID=A0AAF0IKV9_9EURO|nr:hypothetical protein PRK78_003727 [Emydomyces testavorans]